MEMRAEKLQKSTYTPNFNQPLLAACRYHKTCSGQYVLSSKTESACIKHSKGYVAMHHKVACHQSLGMHINICKRILYNK